MYNNKIAANSLKYFAIVFSVTFLWSCSGGGNKRRLNRSSGSRSSDRSRLS